MRRVFNPKSNLIHPKETGVYPQSARDIHTVELVRSANGLMSRRRASDLNRNDVSVELRDDPVMREEEPAMISEEEEIKAQQDSGRDQSPYQDLISQEPLVHNS
jgi:hypothetical protein